MPIFEFARLESEGQVGLGDGGGFFLNFWVLLNLPDLGFESEGQVGLGGGVWAIREVAVSAQLSSSPGTF